MEGSSHEKLSPAAQDQDEQEEDHPVPETPVPSSPKRRTILATNLFGSVLVCLSTCVSLSVSVYLHVAHDDLRPKPEDEKDFLVGRVSPSFVRYVVTVVCVIVVMASLASSLRYLAHFMGIKCAEGLRERIFDEMLHLLGNCGVDLHVVDLEDIRRLADRLRRMQARHKGQRLKAEGKDSSGFTTGTERGETLNALAELGVDLGTEEDLPHIEPEVPPFEKFGTPRDRVQKLPPENVHPHQIGLGVDRAGNWSYAAQIS